ncbi:hypothetical protein [Pseudomonas sp. MF7453]|uniref:hypothetical protein n=1 Tax=Pseudomonas sp. MF7453 TaxID=2797539 RepID=UPI0018E78133|nr:hypothetical protein [Pseudomonas sp. MF7453]MBJ2219116.1 hypothetical protein [Pseudomonas sp. MF7453]
MNVRNLITALTLLLSVNASLADDPAWWSDSKCREQRNKDYASLMLHGFKSHDAIKKIDEQFKICVCSSGDETRVAVQSLADNHEIEMMSNDGVITVPIKYGRDFGMMAYKGQCYLNIGKPELCKNSTFMGEAKQSFNVYETYDEKNNVCAFDFDKQNKSTGG